MGFLEVSAVGRKLNDSWIVNKVSFTQHKLQKIAIAGETGSGKSTVLKMIAGLAQPQQGQILFEGERIEGPAEKLIPGHPGIAYLSQEYALPKFLRVEQVLAYASKIPDLQATHLFGICRITHLLKRRTDELSGGEQQRIALARLLVGQPKLLLLDEPFSNLDRIHKNILKAIIQDMQEQLQLSCILTSHDPQDALSWADEILVMKSGEIVQQGAPQQIYYQPRDEYVAGLFGNYNLLDPLLAKQFVDTAPTDDSKLIVRPEQFLVNQSGTGTVKGTIKNSRFEGNYYSLEVEVEEHILLVQTGANAFKKNERIELSLNPFDVWRLPT